MPLPTYLMSNFPSVRPSLNLQFDSQPTPEDMTSHLASVGATFSRASIGTYTDANGIIQEATSGQARPNYSAAGVHEGLLIEESRTNEITSSEDFTVDWTLTNIDNVISNQAIAPDGTASADEVVVSAGSSVVLQLLTYSLVGDYVGSVFVKAGTLDFVQLNVPNQINASTSNFDLVNGTVNDIHGSGGSIEDYGNGWYRCSLNLSQTSGNGGIGLTPVGSLSASRRVASSGSVYVWGAQLEEGSFPTSYIPTIPTFTSRASDGTYFDSSGVLQTTSGERIDHKYIDGQWVEAGLLLEGSATNLLVRSEEFETSWSKTNFNSGTNPTVTANQAVAPDGTTTADLVEFPAQTGTQVSALQQTGFADIELTASVWVRAVSGTVSNLVFRCANSAITVPEFGTDWIRIDHTASSNATSEGISIRNRPSVSGDGSAINIYIWGGQLEAGSQPTSYIKTTTASATRSADVYTTATKQRSADVCYIDGTAFSDFYNQEEGTFFVYWQGFTDGSDEDRWIGVNDTTLDNRIIFALSQNAETIRLYIETNDSAQTSTLTDTNVPQTTPNKYALALAENDVDSYQDGSFVASDAVVSLPTVTRLTLDNGTGFGTFQGYIRKFIYFPRRLSDNELIKLTQ